MSLCLNLLYIFLEVRDVDPHLSYADFDPTNLVNAADPDPGQYITKVFKTSFNF